MISSKKKVTTRIHSLSNNLVFGKDWIVILRTSWDRFFINSLSIFPLWIQAFAKSGIIEIISIKTDEVICDPPNHELPGISLKSVPNETSRKDLYFPICLIDLYQYENLWMDEDFKQVWKWNDVFDINSSQENMTNEETYFRSRVYFYADGERFC